MTYPRSLAAGRADLSDAETWTSAERTDYPTSGTNLSATLLQNEARSIRTREYQKIVTLFDAYWPVTSKAKVASRLAVCAATEGAPFFDLCSLGATDAMRGFDVTRNLDRRLLSAQVAYRQRITERLGAVAFVGAGAVASDFGSLSMTDGQIAGGIGARIRLSRSFPVDFSIDSAWNEAGERLVYVYVGQRF